MAVEVLGVSTRVGHRICMYTCTLACTPHKVIAWAIGLLYKVWMRGIRSQMYSRNGRERMYA